MGDNGIVPSTTQSSHPVRRVTVAHAHSGEDSYVILELRQSGIEGSVQYPISDLNQVLDLSIAQDEKTARPQIEEAIDRIVDYTKNHFSISSEAGKLMPEIGPFRFLELKTSSYVVIPFALPAEANGSYSRVTVDYDGIIADLPHRTGLLDARHFRGLGSLETFEREQLPFDGATRSHTVTNENLSPTRHLSASVMVVLRNTYRLGRRTAGRALRAVGLRT